MLSHTFDLKPNEQLEVKLRFEVVNVGTSPTSLEPHVFCTGYEIKRLDQTARLEISELDRLLPPHATCTFNAVGRTDATYPFWLFKSFRVCPTRGRDRVTYTRSNYRKVIGRLRYDLELTLYRWTGWLPFLRAKNADD